MKPDSTITLERLDRVVAQAQRRDHFVSKQRVPRSVNHKDFDGIAIRFDLHNHDAKDMERVERLFQQGFGITRWIIERGGHLRSIFLRRHK